MSEQNSDRSMLEGLRHSFADRGQNCTGSQQESNFFEVFHRTIHPIRNTGKVQFLRLEEQKIQHTGTQNVLAAGVEVLGVRLTAI